MGSSTGAPSFSPSLSINQHLYYSPLVAIRKGFWRLYCDAESFLWAPRGSRRSTPGGLCAFSAPMRGVVSPPAPGGLCAIRQNPPRGAPWGVNPHGERGRREVERTAARPWGAKNVGRLAGAAKISVGSRIRPRSLFPVLGRKVVEGGDRIGLPWALRPALYLTTTFISVLREPPPQQPTPIL